MRTEVEFFLEKKGLRFFDLPLGIRLLLVTDGTVTELLEAMVKEPIGLGISKQSVKPVIDNPDFLLNSEKAKCIHRSITLRGSISATDWLYAESIILHEKLDQTIQKLLFDQASTLGSILNTHICDNHREIKSCGYEQNVSIAQNMNLPSYTNFVYRNYHILIATTPIISITEWFPVDRICKIVSQTT